MAFNGFRNPFVLGRRRPSLASLFAPGQPGHWPDSYDPALGRLFQDAAGTIPVTAPGQPVGLVKRMSGTVDAAQATALSRPTLGRWPRGGRRNLLTWSEDISKAEWQATGVGVVKVGQQGVSFLEGYPSSQIYQSLYLSETGIEYTFSANLSGAGTVRIYLVGPDGSTGAPTTVSLTSTPTRYSVTRTMSPGAFQAGASIYNGATGAAATFVIHGAQLEIGPVATPYQRVTTGYEDFDGIPSVWHLYNDGGDSLPITLPAGTYGRARVNTDGVVTVDTVVDPTDALSGTRQVDAILRQGAFSAAEEAQIRAYWARYAA